MNEPQTLREYLNRPVTADEVETGGRWERILIKHNDPILGAHIIPGADVVVTPQGLEDAAGALWRSTHLMGWLNIPPSMQDQTRIEARAAIEAAGIEVVDEVVEVGNDAPGDFQSWPVFRDGDGLLTGCGIDPGDILYIQRADTSTASTSDREPVDSRAGEQHIQRATTRDRED